MPAVFPMLEVMRLPPKPRDRSLLMMSEVGIPLRATEDLSEVAGSLIDSAKITDHAGLIDRLAAGWLKRKVALYNANGIGVLPGGIPFQLAVLQNRVEEYFHAVCDLGFAGVEISEDVIDPLPSEERERLLGRALELGLKGMTEMGRKNLHVAFDVEAVSRQILRDLGLGVSQIYVERREMQELAKTNPRALDRIAALGKNQILLFELGLNQPQEKATWLVERYGPDINFASVAPPDVVAVDAIRRGRHRKASYRYLTGRGGLQRGGDGAA